MSWTKIDDQFYDHPKIVAAGSLGIALFVCGLSYCSRHLTDGFITTAQVQRLTDADDPQAVAERLIEVGLWERRDGGYQVHDFLDYNPSAAKVKATRQARAEAGREGGLRSGEARRKQAEEGKEANAKQTPSKAEAKTNPVPVPVPVPESPSPKEETPSAADAPAPKPKPKPKSQKPPTPEAVKVFRENAHRYPTKSWHGDIVEAVGEKPADLEFWGQVVKAYVGCGWNPGNVKNMLDFYGRREIPGMKGQRKTEGEPAGFEGIREWGRQQGILEGP